MDQGAAAADRAEAGRAEVGLVASVLRKAADGTSRRARPAWTRLMPTPGYRLSDRTGIPDLLISATCERRQPTPIIQICARRGAMPPRCARRASRRGESHPPPLSGPDVTVSRHPAPTVRLAVKAISCQWANRPGLY